MGFERFAGRNVFRWIKGFYRSPTNVHREVFPVAGIYRGKLRKLRSIVGDEPNVSEMNL